MAWSMSSLSLQLPRRSSSEQTKCAVCQKSVYAMEKLEADKIVYHKTCFKCSVCKTILR